MKTMKFLSTILILTAFFQCRQAFAQETELLYLSGTSSDHTVDWQFYCTEGRGSGKWTTIPVPSNWELQGFGSYNYGQEKDSLKSKEQGLYKYKFKTPRNWQGKTINIVFDGSMTDTEVKINGQSAGPVHQGAFYRFKYDVTKLLNLGKTNLLEVTVSKHSSNESVNNAERKGDYWIFGGIYRPVFLEALPQQHIVRTAIDAKADGQFKADIFLKDIEGAGEVTGQVFTLAGEKMGSAFSTSVSSGDSVVHLQAKINSPLQWSPEFPNLYKVEFSLLENGEPVHVVKDRFGFRTFEFRERDGIYVNNVKIKFKGINRHSFWPSTGRTTSKKLSIMDANLMKEMNMNAVRMSHYPPDVHFLDVCDSIGLFVIDELTGWHDVYDTKTGSKLVKEMIVRDVNHPSIVIWSNGNEGGHNLDLDTLFDYYDVQKRSVVHPWKLFRGIDTQHYTNYDYGNGNYFHGHDVFFPTEFLHGLYDGGLGAGLNDFWDLMWHNPLSAGGFLWDFSDEGVVRTDKNGIIDTYGNYAADGIVGPFREKEGSFYTVKEIWAPIWFEHKEITDRFDGILNIENRFHYTNTNQCSFSWKLKSIGEFSETSVPEEKTGTIKAPDIIPTENGKLELNFPDNWNEYDFLYITAKDPQGREIYTWSWPISKPKDFAKRIIPTGGDQKPVLTENDSLWTASVKGIEIVFNKNTGLLSQVKNEQGIIPLSDGPIVCDGKADFEKMSYHYDGNNLVIEASYYKSSNLGEVIWTLLPSGWLKMHVKYFMLKDESDPYAERADLMGFSFSFPEKGVTGVRYLGAGPNRVWKNRIRGNTLDVWQKEYNNTITGVPEIIYPEFKGYYSNMYWAKLLTTGQPMTVVVENEDIFLRLFAPEFPEKPYNTAPAFPTGDISFMHGITPIGTKSQLPVNLGPSGKTNMYFDYWRQRPKEVTLYFDFSGK